MQPEIETAVTPAPAKPKRRKTRRHKRANTAVPMKKAGTEFPGLTPKDCCETCSAAGCIISGTAVCAHPFKGGLQHALLSNAETLARFNRAKKVLGKAKLDVSAA